MYMYISVHVYMCGAYLSMCVVLVPAQTAKRAKTAMTPTYHPTIALIPMPN